MFTKRRANRGRCRDCVGQSQLVVVSGRSVPRSNRIAIAGRGFSWLRRFNGVRPYLRNSLQRFGMQRLWLQYLWMQLQLTSGTQRFWMELHRRVRMRVSAAEPASAR